ERDGLQERVELLLFESNADRKQKDLLTSMFAQERESLVQTTAAEVRAQTEREMNEIHGTVSVCVCTQTRFGRSL
ncbi:hypothetical protein SARC_18149, partial [Sphaeroforma arctica JP610]